MANQHTLHSPINRATRLLPDGYEPLGTFDLSGSKLVMLAVNLLGLVLIVVFGWLFLRLAAEFQPAFVPGISLNIDSGNLPGALLSVLVMLGMIAVVIILHEVVHGIFFWLFTRARPLFGFKGVYAYAAAPDWYIPRNQYMLVGLAPFVLLTLLGVVMLLFVPVSWITPLVIGMTFNASGAGGDLLAVTWLATRPADVLVKDEGDRLGVYGKKF